MTIALPLRSRLRAVVLALGVLAAGATHAQNFPARPIQFLIGTSVGGIADTMGRALAEGMAKRLGVPVIPVNRDGANGVIAAGQVAAARPDGYTVGFQPAGAFVTQPFMNRNLPYTNADIDFLCQVFELPLALAVAADSPIRNVQDLVEAARKRPGEITVGTSGPGSIPHVGLSQLEKHGALKFNHIPYRGDGETINNVLGKHVDVGAIGLTTASGKAVRVLAVFSEKRVPTNADIPTMTELGIPVVTGGMVGLYSRKGMPADVREKLAGACKEAVSSEEVVRVSTRANQPLTYLSPEQWTARIAADSQQNKSVIEALPPSR